MNAAVVVGLAAAVLQGVAGGTVNATVLVYSATEQSVTINGEVATIGPQVQPIAVVLPVTHGVQHHRIVVQTDTIMYTLPVTVVGKQNYTWVWWLVAAPLALMLCAVRLRRAAGSS